MVKTEIGPEKICLNRERSNYKLPAIISCQFIRTMYDIVGPDGDDARVERASMTDDPPCMVFEWMEHDLRAVPSDQFRQNSDLPKVIAKSVLSALALLKSEYGAIHTGEHIALWLMGLSTLTDQTSTQTIYSYPASTGLPRWSK